ncbi:MAG TPA: VanZ family protein [Bradyrhizobium sp.]|nr:VanZ family protein [Bradyrhizobium sp.]
MKDESLSGSRSRVTFRPLLAVTLVVIVYGSLYPFDFRIPAAGAGPLRALLDSWAMRPGRSDFLGNILLYLPLGCFGMLSLPRPMSGALRIFLVCAGGAGLSATMELTQYFDIGRVTSANDVYANVLGTVAGGLAANSAFRCWRLPFASGIASRPVPALLIAALAAYRLYPYVPATDLHKYWAALKPVILDPGLSPGAALRHTVVWLTCFSFISAVVGERRSAVVAPAFCCCILAARVMIVDAVLSFDEIAGAAAAICLHPVMLTLTGRRRAGALFATLAAIVVVERLQPFQFQPIARDFGWIPFRSLLGGSVAVNVMAFFEKTFLYGSLLELFAEAGGRPRTALSLVGGMLLATSWAELYLPGRSAEITDFVILLLLAGGFALVRPYPVGSARWTPHSD